MLTQEEKFELLLERQIQQLIQVNYGYEYYMHIQDLLKERLDELNWAPGFFGLSMESIYFRTLITLLKFYDKKADYNLYKFLNYVKANMNIFNWKARLKRDNLDEDEEKYYKFKHPKLTKETIENYKTMIEENETIINNLFIWRNKYYAHNTKEYFLNPKKIEEDAPVEYIEIKKLIDLAHDILNTYSVAYNGVAKAIMPIDGFDLDIILDFVSEKVEERKKSY